MRHCHCAGYLTPSLTRLVPGPCQFCASIGATCHLDPSRRRQRPYYHVSEEEFRYMTKALEHFLPNIDLNLHSLKEVVRSINSGPAGGDGQSMALSETSDSINVKGEGSRAGESSSAATTAVTIEEIDELHGELGWLRVDSRGTYRKNAGYCLFFFCVFVCVCVCV